MIYVKVTLEDGNSWTTGINASYDQAVDYYLGREWLSPNPYAPCEEVWSKCISVEQLEELQA